MRDEYTTPDVAYYASLGLNEYGNSIFQKKDNGKQKKMEFNSYDHGRAVHAKDCPHCIRIAKRRGQ